MGAFTIWPSGAFGSLGAGVVLALVSAAGAGAGWLPGMAMGCAQTVCMVGSGAGGADLTMRTLPSPSVISSSAMPDSATRSISVLSLRRSMERFLYAGRVAGAAAGGQRPIDQNAVGRSTARSDRRTTTRPAGLRRADTAGHTAMLPHSQ